jgi:uncharacterized protein
MAMRTNCFAWYDLMTSDTAAAARFYKEVIGWDVTSGGGDNPYSIFSINGANVGGLMPIPPEMCLDNAKPPCCWTGYILVDDVDACVARIMAAGGKIYKAPQDIPGVLRFAVVGDPQDAAFIIFKGKSDAPPMDPAPNAVGGVGWHELHTADIAEAHKFYAALFGWTKAEAIDMGPLGIYQVVSSGEGDIGGMMKTMPDAPMPFWLYYINIDGIDAAAARVVVAGGTIRMGPHQVSSTQWIASCTDPQGAWFALVSKSR